MRVCWLSTLLLGLFHSALFPLSTGLEGEKKIGLDDLYKPRKWSQVRDGPYRMIVSSRDQESNESQLDTRKGTRTRYGAEESKDIKGNKGDVIENSPDNTKDEVETESDSNSDQDIKILSRTSKDSSHEGSSKPRVVERRKNKVKSDQDESASLPLNISAKNEKSTQRTVTKLARKRERILSNENFRKAHRVSIPEGYFSTAHPSTISHKLYNHFRPIERGIPRESIIPFFDFGKKLSTGKTPSAINSIEASSSPGIGNYEMTTHREDEELFHEDMDVSVVKLKPVERNAAPRIRAPLKNPEITSFYKSIPATSKNYKESSVRLTTSLPEMSKKDFTTSSPVYTFPPTEALITFPTTIPPSDHSDDERELIDNKPDSSFTPSMKLAVSDEGGFHLDDPGVSPTNSPGSKNENHSSFSTQLPRPSPTAKILSTAVVTSVSVKETYRHPRIKGTEYPVEELETFQNGTKLEFQPLKSQDDDKAANDSPEPIRFNPNQTYRVDKSLGDALQSSTHRPSFERIVGNRTNALLKNNTIQPTTIRPKFRASIEYLNFTTKVPSTTTHKFLNRSLYSTFQREQQKNKFLLSQQFKIDNKNISVIQSNDSSTPRTTIKLSPNSNENKTKMFLTIRSRLPNQSATYRSTFRRNGTKPIPPVLRVIATPSSYIEVPKIINRIISNLTGANENSTVELLSTEKLDTQDSAYQRYAVASLHPNDSSTERPANTNVEDVILTYKHKADSLPKIPNSAREVRMNNHRMPSHETTTELDPSEDLTTLAVVGSITEPPEDVSTYSTRSPTNDPINIITVGPRTGSSTKPGLSWVYLGQKNKTRIVDSAAVEVAYSNGFGIAAYVLAALGVIPLILGGFVLLRQILIKSKKKMLDESEYSSEYNRTPLPAKLPRIPSHVVNWEGEKPSSSLSPGQQSSSQTTSQHQANQQLTPNLHPSNPHQTTQHQPQPGKWEFPRDKLRLQTLLGEGNFGQVWKAEADDISGHEGLTRLVAVKTVKEGSGGREREDLLRELAIMKELGSHPNVVTLLGCCTDREPFLLIMEYVMYGKMLTFLREHRTRAHYFNFSDLNSALVSRDLTVFAYCVSRGMEFLVSKGIIHRDLAARNILVDHNKLCKIADFGMSRNVRDTGEIYEQRPNRGALPIRWMAPEALHCSVFTHKSDVWSFGILVWEIITLGCTPYQTMGAREVMRRVREGYRLDRPIHCSQDLYKVITKCWAADPSKRPTFTDLKHDVATLLSDPQTNGACVDLDALTEEMSSHSC